MGMFFCVALLGLGTVSFGYAGEYFLFRLS